MAATRRLATALTHVAPHRSAAEQTPAIDEHGRGAPLDKIAGHITADEVAALQIHPSTLAAIAEAFAQDGFAIVTGLFDHALLDRMSDKLDNDAGHQLLKRVLEDRQAGTHSAAGVRHIANGLPRHAPWVFPEVVASPLVEQLVSAMLGGSAFIRYYNGNTSLPDDPSDPKGVQGAHMDGGGWSVSSQAEADEVSSHAIVLRLLVNCGPSLTDCL